MRYEGTVYRPPSEAGSLIIQLTIGCARNTCTFCNMYKDKKFRIRPLEEVAEDLEMARKYYSHIKVRRIFLADGDALIVKTQDLLYILDKCHEYFPEVERISVYGAPKDILGKTPEELKTLRKAGLTRAYLGVESGSDALLHAVKKGADARQMLEAGIRLREAGFDLWVMVILGLAGPGEAGRRHILDTAAMINEMRPRHLSALTLTLYPGTDLYQEWRAGRFQAATARDTLREARLLIEKLEVDPLHFTCDHASNYVPLKGGLPEDRAYFLSPLDQALESGTGMRPEWSRGL